MGSVRFSLQAHLRWSIVALTAVAMVATADRVAAGATFTLQEIAPGLLVHVGANEDFTSSNRGGIANLGLIVGSEAVAVIDTGGSLAQGIDFLAAIRTRTDRPVRWIVITHAHPDHMLGSAAFAQTGAAIVGHARATSAILERGPSYLANLGAIMGDALDGSTLVPPSLTIEAGEQRSLDLGDRRIVVQAWPTAHTDNDLTVLDEKTGTLFAGDLVQLERLPVVDGSLNGWLAVLDDLERIPARRVVPGHGPAVADWPAALAPERAYLTGLRRDVRAALAEGRGLSAVLAEPLPETPGFLPSENDHRRNLTAAYTELEWE